jgi:D-serine deaminase-like pyridoxal phosphate-dependent protein
MALCRATVRELRALWVGRPAKQLDTPVLVLRRDRLATNATAMATAARGKGKHLRPHSKTHKCARVAALQLRDGEEENGDDKKETERVCVGYCVATVGELEAMVLGPLGGGEPAVAASAATPNVGREAVLAGLEAAEARDRQLLRFAPVLVTSAPATQTKASRLLEVRAANPNVMTVVDSPENARMLSEGSVERGFVLDVLVEVDGGQTRTGTTLGAAAELCHLAAGLPGLKLRGIQTYVGHLQHVESVDERRHLSLFAMNRGAALVRDLRAAGLELDIYTGTGTGTYMFDFGIPELTDAQVGSYIVYDQEYSGIEWGDDEVLHTLPAPMNMLTTVVNNQHENMVTVDCGLKAMYKDGPGVEILSPPAAGLGKYDWAGDEHGYIRFPDDAAVDLKTDLPVGTVVSLRVSHCDPTVNLHDVFFVTDESDTIVDVWQIDARGCTI